MQSKQKTLHSALGIPNIRVLSGAMWIFCIACPVPSVMAETQTLLPTRGEQVATMRLIKAAGLSDGRYDVGVEIRMTPGSHTYWKQPGDAGVPPVFAFNGSANVAEAKVLFPAPKRISEGGIEAFGYTDRVTFPVVVMPKEAGKPAVLKLVMDYAVCNKICIPAHGTASLDLSPDGTAVDGTQVASAFHDLPLPLPPAETSKLAVLPETGAAKPSWTITWAGDTPVDDIFAIAPEGFYFDTKKLAPNTFKLTAVQVSVAERSVRVPISLTLAQKTGSLVTTQMLDVPRVMN